MSDLNRVTVGDQEAFWRLMRKEGFDAQMVQAVLKTSGVGYTGVLRQAILNFMTTLEALPHQERFGRRLSSHGLVKCFGPEKWGMFNSQNQYEPTYRTIPWRADVFNLELPFEDDGRIPFVYQRSLLLYVPAPDDMPGTECKECSSQEYGGQLATAIYNLHDCRFSGLEISIAPSDYGWHLLTATYVNTQDANYRSGRPERPINYIEASPGVSILGMLAALAIGFEFVPNQHEYAFIVPGSRHEIDYSDKTHAVQLGKEFFSVGLGYQIFGRRRPEVYQHPTALTLGPRN